MKKLILFLLLIPFLSFAQPNNVRLSPDVDTVCYETSLSIWIAGNSFQPMYYYWSSPGSVLFTTTPTIPMTQSGYYSLTVTGFMGNSSKMRTYTFQRYYHVLDKPKLNFTNGPWVCRFDTVRVNADAGYDSYTWYNGTTGISFTKVMDSVYSAPVLDTTKIYYTARINGLCEVTSMDTVIRGVRAPNGVGSFYCGKLNIRSTDSIPAGLVLDYLFPSQYEMEFTQVSNPSVVITYLPPLGSRKTPANILTPGEQYYVRSRVIINGQTFCWGTVCLIGIRPPAKAQANIGYDPKPAELDFPTIAIKEYRIFTMEGKLVNTYKSEMFNEEWLGLQPQGIYIIHVIYQNNIVAFKYQK